MPDDKIQHAAPVPPFVRFVASAVPMVFDNSLSYYEALCALWKWMQDNLVNVVNNNASVTEQYIEYDLHTRELFIELQSYVDNYFDNLDVQEEINNKLDDMVEAGTLQEIITTYIQSNVAWTFDTVADMKLATNLVDGSYARTLGFYSINDQGGSLYKVSNTGTANEIDVIAIDSLFATKVSEVEVCVEQFGAKGDGTTDDTESIRSALTSGASKVNFVKDKTYMVTPYNALNEHGLLIPSGVTVDLNGATVKVITNTEPRYKVFSIIDADDVTLRNGRITGDVEGHTGTGEWGYGVSIIHSTNVVLDNLYIEKCWGDGININFEDTTKYYSDNITIINCICNNNRRQGMSIEAGNNIHVEHCQFINTGGIKHTNPSAGVDIEPLVSNQTLTNIYFGDCLFKNNYGMQFVGGGSQENNIIVNNITIDNCQFIEASSPSDYIFSIRYMTDSKVINSVIDGLQQMTIAPKNDFIFDGNIVRSEDIMLRPTYSENATFYFRNNTFKTPTNTKSGIGYLHNYTTATAGRNNTVVIDNNKFIDKTSGSYIYDYGMIFLIQNRGIDKAIITNNYIEGSGDGIAVSCSSIIKHNTIVGTKTHGLSLLASVTEGTEVYHDIEDNNFQNCGSDGTIIFNSYRKNLVIRNNLYWPIYFNSGIGATDRPKTGWLTYNSNLTGYKLIENNTILTVTS